MADELASFAEIEDVIRNTEALTLNAKLPGKDRKVLGEGCLGLLAALFGRQASFGLTKCAILEGAQNHLIFGGTFDRLLSWDPISVEIALIDLAVANGKSERHCVFRINNIPEDTVYSFGDQFLRSGTPSHASEGMLARGLEHYVRNVSFGEKAMVFSSADQSAVRPATKLSANFTVPAVNATVSITVGSTVWMGGNGYDLFITGVGYYQVQSITSSTQVVVLNLGTSSNAPVGTNVTSGAAVVPSRLHRLMTLDTALQINAGVNIPVDLTLDEDLEQYLRGIVGEVGKAGKSQGLIYPGDDGLYLMFRKEIVTPRLDGDVGMELQGVGILLPAVVEHRPRPRIVFDGALIIGTKSFKMRADFNAYYETLAVSFYDFPSLKEIIDLVGNGAQDAYFGEPISSLLTVKLSSLGMVFGLRDKSVSEISFSVTAQEDIKLVENIISFKPALNMRIEAPFQSELRSVEGELKGAWHLGTTKFETALYYPSFNFFAGMAQGQTLDVDVVWKRLLSGIDLNQPPLGFTKMELYGNFQNKSFSAEIALTDESKCEFSIAGRSFGFQIKNMLMAHDNQGVSYAMDGSLVLAGVQVLLSARYETGQGWLLSGSTAVGKTINLSELTNDLMEAMALRTKLPEFALTDIVFTAAPKLGEYSLSGRSAEPWQLTKKLSLTIEQFAIEKRQGWSVTGLIRVALAIGETVVDGAVVDGIVVRLSAEKAAAVEAGGWKFEGSSAEGKKIKIPEIIRWIGEKFGETPQLPEALESFTIDKLKLSFESEKRDFFFTCEGEVSLSRQGRPVRGIVTIDIKNQGESYTKLFGGSLIIDGMEFDLVFEWSHKATGGDSRTFVAAYHDDKGHAIKIDDLTKKVFTGEVPTTGLEIGLKDALFAYQKADQAKYLFGLDIDAGLNLSELNLPNLPLIGQAFAGGQTLRLAFQVLAAPGDTFTVQEIDGLNRLSRKGISLPKQEVKGLQLAALLRVGQETKPLSLPIGLGKGNGQGTGELVEDKTVSTTSTNQPAVYPSSADGTQWITIQKTFGPIHVERVGLGYHTGNIALVLDAALTAAGLTLSLDGLGAEFALKDLTKKVFKPTFHLNGLGIDYRSGPVEIGGSFLEQKWKLPGNNEVEYTSYAGMAVIRTKKLTLSAIGSYTQLNDRDPSLFIYAVANYPLGGPAFFYVTGFAAGFGYNRAITLPAIDEIASFPLVAEAVKDAGPASLPSTQQEQRETLTNKLQQLERYLPPSVGDIFIAAGIKFTSFKQIDSFALLVVKFGRRFEIDLLGLSTLTAPPPEAAKTGGKTVAPIAEAQLLLKASFIPDEGFLGVRAQLTSNSYILSKDCHLNGGFAFYTWFEPHPQAGDFVLTLGGYHPKFIAPDHYPQVPRLSLNWQVSSELHIKADAYFALTGSAIMAGGHLQATWESGDLRAWFNAGADFILAWKPFHYDLELYVGMGVSYTFKALGNQTLNVDLGANLHLWGPEFSGTATIHWSIISFTVSFGHDAPQQLEPIEWNSFKSSFLPKPDRICSIAVQQGLMRQIKAEGNQPERWIVNPKEMVLAVHSAIPFNKVDRKAALAEEDLEQESRPLAIAPMGIESNLTSTCSITIKHAVNPTGEAPAEDKFQLRPVRKPMPAGLWGKPNLTNDRKHLNPPSLNGPQLVENLLAGLEIRPIKKNQQAQTCYIDRDKLQYTTTLVQHAKAWRDFEMSGSPGQSAWDDAAETVIHTREKRDKLAKAFGLVNAVIDVGEPVDHGVFAGGVERA